MTSPVEHYKFVTVFVIKDLFVDYHIYYYIVIEVLYLQWPMAVVAKKIIVSGPDIIISGSEKLSGDTFLPRSKIASK